MHLETIQDTLNKTENDENDLDAPSTSDSENEVLRNGFHDNSDNADDESSDNDEDLPPNGGAFANPVYNIDDMNVNDTDDDDGDGAFDGIFYGQNFIDLERNSPSEPSDDLHEEVREQRSALSHQENINQNNLGPIERFQYDNNPGNDNLSDDQHSTSESSDHEETSYARQQDTSSSSEDNFFFNVMQCAYGNNLNQGYPNWFDNDYSCHLYILCDDDFIESLGTPGTCHSTPNYAAFASNFEAPESPVEEMYSFDLQGNFDYLSFYGARANAGYTQTSGFVSSSNAFCVTQCGIETRFDHLIASYYDANLGYALRLMPHLNFLDNPRYSNSHFFYINYPPPLSTIYSVQNNQNRLRHTVRYNVSDNYRYVRLADSTNNNLSNNYGRVVRYSTGYDNKRIHHRHNAANYVVPCYGNDCVPAQCVYTNPHVPNYDTQDDYHGCLEASNSSGGPNNQGYSADSSTNYVAPTNQGNTDQRTTNNTALFNRGYNEPHSSNSHFSIGHYLATENRGYAASTLYNNPTQSNDSTPYNPTQCSDATEYDCNDSAQNNDPTQSNEVTQSHDARQTSDPLQSSNPTQYPESMHNNPIQFNETTYSDATRYDTTYNTRTDNASGTNSQSSSYSPADNFYGETSQSTVYFNPNASSDEPINLSVYRPVHSASYNSPNPYVEPGQASSSFYNDAPHYSNTPSANNYSASMFNQEVPGSANIQSPDYLNNEACTDEALHSSAPTFYADPGIHHYYGNTGPGMSVHGAPESLTYIVPGLNDYRAPIFNRYSHPGFYGYPDPRLYGYMNPLGYNAPGLVYNILPNLNNYMVPNPSGHGAFGMTNTNITGTVRSSAPDTSYTLNLNSPPVYPSNNEHSSPLSSGYWIGNEFNLNTIFDSNGRLIDRDDMERAILRYMDKNERYIPVVRLQPKNGSNDEDGPAIISGYEFASPEIQRRIWPPLSSDSVNQSRSSPDSTRGRSRSRGRGRGRGRARGQGQGEDQDQDQDQDQDRGRGRGHGQGRARGRGRGRARRRGRGDIED